MSFKEVATGTLGINWRKVNAGQPDYTGQLKMDGRTLNVSVWNKRRNDTGQAFWSYSISEAIPDRPEAAPPLKGEKKRALPSGAVDEDDIPF